MSSADLFTARIASRWKGWPPRSMPAAGIATRSPSSWMSPEDTLLEALELYREAYGPAAVAGDFVIRFEPRLSVYRVIMIA